MKQRREARHLALEVLYEAEIKDALPLEALELREAAGWSVGAADDAEQPMSPEAVSYARRLLEALTEHRSDVDLLIERAAERWALDRMPLVDRNILRIGVVELLWIDDVPNAVAINEAVEIAKALSTDSSGRFVNGVLGKIAEQEA